MSNYRRMSFHLETERLTLRPWAESDAVEVNALMAEREDGKARTVEHTRASIVEMIVATESTGIALLPIQRREEDDFIGYCGLIIGRSTLDEPEIAYELFPRAHGQGYATEAARAVLGAAAATGRTRLWSTVRDWNAPSFRVLEKLGFERDHVVAEEDAKEKGELVWLTRSLP
ncbi:GNAT family N-acetyltransferase [Streptomyces sp. NPDC047973]|uniref:GNAT family N-acetyltransferase n=1 Tax=Streptomyces sp. NPDC047973 TaxID=3155383 RepID=UPI003430DDD7